tara:strand:- start:34 stop:624 length:591 start_codon:yes stop_codon:yes gene_type:complete
MAGVCDCMDLPYAVCAAGSCELAYCSEPNPAGCSQTGCPEGYECAQIGDCVASSCFCDESYGFWGCTEDCGGGTCSLIQSLGDINDDGNINISDIILLVNFILQIIEPSPSQFSAGDYNEDGSLSVVDIVRIVNVILNPAPALPEECYIEPEVGPCLGLCPTYYYNQNNNQCEEFMTGCCGVEAFNTMQDCQNICE